METDFEAEDLTWQAWARLMPTLKRADMPGGRVVGSTPPGPGSITRIHLTTASTISSLVNWPTRSMFSPTSLWGKSITFSCKYRYIPVNASVERKQARKNGDLRSDLSESMNKDLIDFLHRKFSTEIFYLSRISTKGPSKKLFTIMGYQQLG